MSREREIFELECYACHHVATLPVPADARVARCPACGAVLMLQWREPAEVNHV